LARPLIDIQKTNYEDMFLVVLGIPLAVGISPSESIDALTRLFKLIKQVLPENSFYFRGRDKGPELVMTDDSAAEQGALKNVWPQ